MMKAIKWISFLSILLTFMAEVSLESLEACIDCESNNEIGNLISPPEGVQKRTPYYFRNATKPEVEGFEEEEPNPTTTATIDSPKLPSDGEDGNNANPDNSPPSTKRPLKRFRVKGQKKHRNNDLVKEDLEKSESTTTPLPEGAEDLSTPTPEGVNEVKDLLQNVKPSLTIGPETVNPPELIEDAPLRHGSLDALRHYEGQKESSSESEAKPPAPTQSPPHHLFMTYPENNDPLTHDTEDSSSEEIVEGGRPSEVTDEDDMSNDNMEPRCFTPSDFYNGASKMAKGFRKKETIMEQFGVLGRSIGKAAESVVECAHSVWNGAIKLLPF